mgnify:CR=1 FL=1
MQKIDKKAEVRVVENNEVGNLINVKNTHISEVNKNNNQNDDNER